VLAFEQGVSEGTADELIDPRTRTVAAIRSMRG
jgi:hypothetical protein